MYKIKDQRCYSDSDAVDLITVFSLAAAGMYIWINMETSLLTLMSERVNSSVYVDLNAAGLVLRVGGCLALVTEVLLSLIHAEQDRS